MKYQPTLEPNETMFSTRGSSSIRNESWSENLKRRSFSTAMLKHGGVPSGVAFLIKFKFSFVAFMNDYESSG